MSRKCGNKEGGHERDRDPRQGLIRAKVLNLELSWVDATPSHSMNQTKISTLINSLTLVSPETDVSRTCHLSSSNVSINREIIFNC